MAPSNGGSAGNDSYRKIYFVIQLGLGSLIRASIVSYELVIEGDVRSRGFALLTRMFSTNKNLITLSINF